MDRPESSAEGAAPRAPSAAVETGATVQAHEPARGGRLLTLSLAALGVVYGDIGTSPLYAVRECFFGEHGFPATEENVLGVLSLVVWALLFVISLKYLAVVMRADNRGEGGILALMSLVDPGAAPRTRGRTALVALGLFGAALLYGDGMITPAISVLSAVEGLEVVTPLFRPYVLPITVAILIGLFAIQSKGTAKVGAVFGPITLLWFVVLALLGLRGIALEPSVLAALSPVHAVTFFGHNGAEGFLVLGAVFLVVTGGEALYADMSHFGKRPIRLAWFVLVLPCLLVNYLGQGALVLSDPEAAHNPFYRLAPGWALLPLVGLATLATIIASQAVISGAFTLTRQAMQLGYCPRVKVVQTSAEVIGQIYVGAVNWTLLAATVALVLGFGSSTRLASAYGVAVTTTMVITTLLLVVVMRQHWRWTRGVAFAVTGAFLVVDLAFFGASVAKVAHGGWFPLVVAGTAFLLMETWRRGREILSERLRSHAVPVGMFVQSVASKPPTRVPGTAVFMTRNVQGVPPALLLNLKENKVLHEQVVLCEVRIVPVPHVPDAERLEVAPLEQGFWRVVVRYGFMDHPDVPTALSGCTGHGLRRDDADTTWFLGNERLVPTPGEGMALWRERLFALMSRNSLNATTHFGLPADRVIEMGTRIEL